MNLTTSRLSRVLAAIAYVLAAGGVLFVFSLMFVCIASDDCL